MKMSFPVLVSTQEEKKGFTVTEIETIYGMRCALEAKTMRRLPGWKICRDIKSICAVSECFTIQTKQSALRDST